MKSHPYKEMAQRLYDLAMERGGYFTAKQALATGYAKSTHSYNVQAGNWIREHRGIYRLAKYPMAERPDLIEWTLWSSNRQGEPQGVISHETALSVYELSDVNPAKIHMTVPPDFRRSAPAPKVLQLHRGPVGKSEVRAMHGYRVTKPLRTIGDLLQAKTVERDHIEQAVKQAFARALIAPHELEEARMPAEIRAQIEELRKS